MTDYDIIASVYDEFTDGFDHIDYLDRIFEIAPFLPKEGLAVDCGCGTGTLITDLTKRGYSCTGVDISPEMLEIAAEKLDENNGLLLCAHHDALFDKHLITFDNAGNAQISPTLSAQEQLDLGLTTLPSITVTPALLPYLAVHQSKLRR